MSAPTTPPGVKLGRYELLARLGSGGMGEVWVARQKSLGGFERLVAVKRLLPRFTADPVFVQRFATEAQVAASLSHPHIVQIHDLAEEHGEVFIAMELVRGETLQALIRRAWELTGQPVSPAIGAGIMARVCRALHHAHTHVDPVSGQAGLVHRDVAPANVLIGFRGEVKVVDFGIARALSVVSPSAGAAAGGPLHGDGQNHSGVVGSGGRAAYMSPEQARSEELDARSDIFAAGIVLWELLTGMRLFGGMEAAETKRVVAGTEAVRLAAEARPGLDAELAAIAARALEKERGLRFSSAAEMAQALETRLAQLGSPLADEHVAALMERLFRDQMERWSLLGVVHARPAPAPAPIVVAPTPPPTPTPAAAPTPPPTPTPAAAPTPAPETAPAHELDLFEATLPETMSFSETTDPDEVRRSELIRASEIEVFIDDAAPGEAPEPAPEPEPEIEAPESEPAPEPGPFDIASYYYKARPTEGAAWTLDVALLWGETVVSSRSFAASQDVVLADSDTADFAIPREVLGAESVRLVRGVDAGFALDLSSTVLKGDVLLGEKVRDISDLATEMKTLPIEGAFRGRLKVGEFTLLMAHTPVVAAIRLKQPFDRSTLYFIGLSALFQLAFVIIGLHTPDDLLMASRDPRAQRQKVIQALKITPEQLEQEAKKEEAAKELELNKDKKPEEELKVDKQAVAKVDAPMPAPRPSPIVDKMNRKKEQPKPSDFLLPPTSVDEREALTDLKARLAAPKSDSSIKLAGVQTSVPGPSAPANDVSRINGIVDGLPTADTPGFSKDAGTPSNGPLSSDAANDIGKKLAAGTPPKTGNVRGKVTGMKSATKVSGSLDPGQVYDVIDRSIGKIQACYESRLRVDGSLAGRITFRWTVLTTGGVGSVQQTASTVSDPEVAACVKRVLQTLRFPKPDGGVVEVSYPFIFRSS